ncbi:hypothetical protein [Thermogemmatispora sp.]|uniref:hypothetical protein n=1 Tax=Thermogemmatispora sp. TaxID=1968838 RepID=UPI001DE1CA0C|nr:hypothetical protein [Thermogemmatispora sp.]MBX5449852.1 hypothetical protein [Thermogemmatispora sp.]
MAEEVLAVMRAYPLGREATMIGSVQAQPPGIVFPRTEIGSMHLLDMLVGDLLPHICSVSGSQTRFSFPRQYTHMAEGKSARSVRALAWPEPDPAAWLRPRERSANSRDQA